MELFEPRKIVCEDCGTEFEFTQEEAKFFNEKGFNSYPKRCYPCRQARKARYNQERTR